MENLDKIHEYINASTMTLIINNNSKSLLDALFNIIYNKYTLSKCKVSTTRRLMLKLATIKNKLICHELDLSRIQFSSTKNGNRIRDDFSLLKSYLEENNSKILFKINITDYEIYEDLVNIFERSLYNIIPQYDIFNLIIFISKKNIRILRFQTDNKYFNITSPYCDKEKFIFDITTLVRSTKLKNIQKKYIDN